MCPRLRWRTARRARLEASEEERAAVEVGLVEAEAGASERGGGGGGGGPVQAGFDSTMARDLLVFVMKAIDASVAASANSTSYMVCPAASKARYAGQVCCKEGDPYAV